MSTTIVKATELAGAYPYPANRLNQRERTVVTVAESYSPAVPGNWATPPTTQDQALDALAAAGTPQQYGAHTTSVAWDYTVNGGAVGVHTLSASLPAKAIVLEVVRDVTTSCTGGGTIELGLATDGNLEQTPYTMNAGTSYAESGGTTLPKKTTAAEALQVTIAGSDATAGHIRYFIRWVQSE